MYICENNKLFRIIIIVFKHIRILDVLTYSGKESLLMIQNIKAVHFVRIHILM